MGCFPFAKFHYQMGVTIMGFAEDFGHSAFVNSIKLLFGGMVFFVNIISWIQHLKPWELELGIIKHSIPKIRGYRCFWTR